MIAVRFNNAFRVFLIMITVENCNNDLAVVLIMITVQKL